MKIEVTEDYNFILSEVYNPVLFRNNSGETITVSIRDNGFEFEYAGEKFAAKSQVISHLEGEGK